MKQCGRFLREKKIWWLLPMIFVLAMIGALLFFAKPAEYAFQYGIF